MTRYALMRRDGTTDAAARALCLTLRKLVALAWDMMRDQLGSRISDLIPCGG